MSEINTDPIESMRDLTAREKVGIQILMIIFRIIFPVRYNHQFKEAFAPVLEIIKLK